MIEFKAYDNKEDIFCCNKIKKISNFQLDIYECDTCGIGITFRKESNELSSIKINVQMSSFFLYEKTAFIFIGGNYKKYINYPLIKFPASFSEIKIKLEKLITLI